jgi:hypothetical protein
LIITSGITPIRVQRAFNKWTRLSLQVRSAFTLNISHEQGEAQSAQNGNPDGLQLTQASTTPPYDFWWKGELWHFASADQSLWSLIIVGEIEDSADVHNSQSRLDYSVRGPLGCQ